MKLKNNKYLLLKFVLIMATYSLQAQEHPNLILTKAGVEKIKKNLGKVPLFDQSLKKIQDEVDKEIVIGIHTPIPKDYSGGYTHVRHKRNFIILQKAGVLFQILGDEKYAEYIKKMLFQYEAMYINLPVHPKLRSYARGKLFWQCLNDSNWLVYVSQAYDCVYNWLSAAERKKLETNLFKPFADFISIKNPLFFNRVHNHSTWGNAAVGMIGLVMNDKELVNRALYGIENDGIKADAKDNDGGFIKNKDGKAGFLANLDEPFSPDGYYTEGPYYQRYAMYPFLVFAEGLHHIKPELKIFEYKNGVLLKSVNTLLNLSDANGDFFTINDAQKGMSYYSRELVTSVDIAYHFGGHNPQLLSIAKKHNRVLLDDTGLSVAMGISEGKERPFKKTSINLSDGPDGKQGGLAILRYGNEDLTLVFKYGAQGLSHGHYDKLSFSLFEKGDEVIQDYGLARFVNIEQKGGGNYLKENKTWAKQSIAHNTVILNQKSHFQGKYEIGSKHHSELYFFDIKNKNIKIISAKDKNAYPGSILHRTMAIIKVEEFQKPYVLDILLITSKKENLYDYPYYFMGQIIKTNFKYDSPKTLQALGDKNGYQHLYLEGKGKSNADNIKLSWLNKGKYYTSTFTTLDNDNLMFTRIGANDPEFNLRREAGFMIRRKNETNTIFTTLTESHGSYSPVSEFSLNSNSSISNLKVVYNDDNYTAILISDLFKKNRLFILSSKNASTQAKHSLTVDNKKYQWVGPYYFTMK